MLLADLEHGPRVIEIGCGTGNLVLLAEQLHPEADVTGIDPDPAALERAARKAARRGAAVELVPGFAQRLPFEDGSFDRVLSAFMVHHLQPDVKEAALAEARRVLAPGGSLHIVDFGGHVDPSDGTMARAQLRNPHLRGSLGTAIPDLLRAVGFAEASEVAHRVTRLGRITHWRGSVPER